MYLWLEKGDPTHSVDIVRLVSDCRRRGRREIDHGSSENAAARARDRLSKEVEAIVGDPNTNPRLHAGQKHSRAPGRRGDAARLAKLAGSFPDGVCPRRAWHIRGAKLSSGPRIHVRDRRSLEAT